MRIKWMWDGLIAERFKNSRNREGGFYQRDAMSQIRLIRDGVSSTSPYKCTRVVRESCDVTINSTEITRFNFSAGSSRLYILNSNGSNNRLDFQKRCVRLV